VSRNFHTLHLHVGASEKASSARDGVIDALRDHLRSQGFEPVRRAADADRVVRISRARAGWISISDDGHGIEAMVKHVTRATRLPALEAYCEASAIVGMTLHRRGKIAGGWGAEPLPSARAVTPLLAVGTAEELAAAWDDAQRQIFPEAALAVAARRFGLDIARVFDESASRGTTLSLRRTRAAWEPVRAKGPPRFEIGFGSNQGHGGSHLVFVHRTITLTPTARSLGGAGRGLTITFGGDVIDRGLFAPERVTVESLGDDPTQWTAEVRDQRAFLPDVKIPAGLTEQPDVFTLTRREADRARALAWAAELRITITGKTLGEGTGTLRMSVGAGSADPIDEGTLALAVLFEPFRPRHAQAADDHALFAMHQKTRRFVTISLDAPIAAAWAWARSAIARWCLGTRAAGQLGLIVDGEVVESGHVEHGDVAGEDTALTTWNNVAARLEAAPDAWIQLRGPGFAFGHVEYAPYRRLAGEAPAVVLTLDEPEGDAHADLARALADEAMQGGLGLGALLARYRHAPGIGATAWEQVTTGSSEALRYRAWHAERIRGLDGDGVWLGPTHVARIDPAQLPAHVEATAVGPALRLTMPADRPRRDLAALEEALAPLLPSRAAAEAWESARSPR
jgi:hypothetical protein